MTTSTYNFLNSFRQESGKGVIDLRNGANNCLQVQFDPASNATSNLVPGQAVKFVTGTASTVPLIDETTATTDAPAGIVVYQVKNNSHAVGEMLSIARTGTVIIMEAAAAINRGVKVEFVVSGQKVQTVSSGKRIGQALDYAAQSGDLIRVWVDLEY